MRAVLLVLVAVVQSGAFLDVTAYEKAGFALVKGVKGRPSTPWVEGDVKVLTNEVKMGPQKTSAVIDLSGGGAIQHGLGRVFSMPILEDRSKFDDGRENKDKKILLEGEDLAPWSSPTEGAFLGTFDSSANGDDDTSEEPFF